MLILRLWWNISVGLLFCLCVYSSVYSFCLLGRHSGYLFNYVCISLFDCLLIWCYVYLVTCVSSCRLELFEIMKTKS